MPRIYKPGQRIRNYTVIKDLNRGMMAVSYAAKNGGEPVFLKQYKSPTILVSWYKDYISYQKELKRRIESSPCRNFCYRFLDFFEHERCYFQVFEFLDRSWSLEQVLEKCQKQPEHVGADQRLIMAKVLMSGMATLHKAQIIHSDLKPANIMLIEDRSILAGYRLRIIDMDFSLLADRRAPWHGDSGYFGTAGYLSPEHVQRKVPGEASDTFTLGLMLYELLGEGHPYRHEDDYDKAVLAYRVKPPVLQGELARLANAAQVRDTIHRCLSPRAKDRPSAQEVNQVLNNVGGVPAPPPGERPAAPSPSPAPTPAPPAAVGRLVLRSGDGKEKLFNVRTAVGRTLCGHFGPDSQYWDEVQFVLDRDGTGWFVTPEAAARNETILNGKKITVRTALKEGDVLAVGREAKKIIKLPLTVVLR